jgi:hypothetical protein
MPVVRYQGLTLVAERPHFLGRDVRREGAPAEFEEESDAGAAAV